MEKRIPFYNEESAKVVELGDDTASPAFYSKQSLVPRAGSEILLLLRPKVVTRKAEVVS
jgi:hypothetical protein